MQLIAAAARARFVEKGWAGTSVRSVAEGAGVSEATVYNVYGSKAGLASSLIDAAEQSADVAGPSPSCRSAPVTRSGSCARSSSSTGGSSSSVVTSSAILAEGQRQHPELGAAYEEGRCRGDSERREGLLVLAGRGVAPGRSTSSGPWPSTCVVVSLQSFDIATREHGWSPDEVEKWWHSTLVELLMAASGDRVPARRDGGLG